ncbi:MAG: hypothetical protein JSV90_02440 [Methanobacteriota archaeon]|nr:MAG: hypothetical protein JSV90_02440 [Euryarchaeota archaeon]
MKAASPSSCVCPLLVTALAALLILSSQAVPPLLSVDAIRSLDADTTVRVYGVVASVFIWEGGEVLLLLADHISGSTLEVQVDSSRSADCAEHVRVGDQALIDGRTASRGHRPILFATTEDIVVLARSEHILSVGYLCENWRLFEHDRFNISGVLEWDEDAADGRLHDPQGDKSIRLRTSSGSGPVPDGARVTADCTLLLDLDTMTMFLWAWRLTMLGG